MKQTHDYSTLSGPIQMTESGIFKVAVKLPVEQRAAYLEQACGTNRALREEVESLLRAHEEPQSFLDRPAIRAETAERQIADRPGTVIGPYRLVEQIGEGGFGLVFVAEQEHPVRRKVALKVVKPGMDTRDVIARFELERQALAIMDHPNIAHVLDGGETPSGRPYFVMELVKGPPITEYCDEHKLSPRERLVLFVEICHAVQHAHQKGVIHRDLKPTNVLVAVADDRPIPKVIDFGVSKAIGEGLRGRTLTGLGSIVGTLEYMSPEQAEFNARDVDTRADIYGLGVLLYELLTGTPPLTKERLKQAAMTEALRLIREEEPPRPSTRLSDSKKSLASISAQRRMEPARLTKVLRGELDWIVMKALEKDRARRYATASGLARDIERYLQDEPVEACPPSAIYRMRKFARRHKKALAVAATFALLLLASTIVSIGLASWALQERNAAHAQKLMAEKSEHEAKERNDETRAVLDFVENQVFAAARPLGQEGGLGGDVTLRRAIESTLPHVEGSFPDQPLIEARLLSTLGVSFLYLSDAKTAERLFRRARELRAATLGPEDAETLGSMTQLGRSLYVLGRFREALKLQEETLDLQKAKLGHDHQDTLRSMANLANTYAALARMSEAVELKEKTLQLMKAKLGPDHPDTIKNMNGLAMFYLPQHRYDEALKLSQETFERRENSLGPTHPDTLRSMSVLAECHERAGRHAEAVKLGEEALQLQDRILSRDHVDTLRTMYYLARSYAALNRHEEALNLGEETLRRRSAILGANHLDTRMTLNFLVNCYTSLGRPADAARLRASLPQHGKAEPDKKAKP